jgi:hypothetical protein
MSGESNLSKMVQTEDEEVKERYVSWKSRRVKIPKSGYRPGGIHSEYSSKTVEATLNFYYRELICGDIADALTEEHEDGHNPDLLNAVFPVVIKECEGNLAKNLKRLYLKRMTKDKQNV